MSRYHSHINSAKEIIKAYDGHEPFAAFLKKRFSANKKFGSKDRKQIAHLCYCYYRLGKACSNLPTEEKILIAVFLCATETSDLLAHLKPAWNELATASITDKLAILEIPIEVNDFFPFELPLSSGIDPTAFALGQLVQPDLFLRVRPNQKEKVSSKLTAAGIAFQWVTEDCIAVPNATKIEAILQLNKEAVVQDYNSQRVAEFLLAARDLFPSSTQQPRVWDCCAASGGKSIMLFDLLPGIELTVSDVRNTILVNLQERFEAAGIKKYNSFVADLADPAFVSHHSEYDLIIADVPCSGSGTWGRTPEQAAFFNASKIESYASLQKKISSNVVPYVRSGGLLLYITCSVFAQENEEVVRHLTEQNGLQLLKMQLLQSDAQKADTLFAALFKKP